MKKSLLILSMVVFLLFLINPLITFSQEQKYNTNQPFYYWEKGNNSIVLSHEEYLILISNLEKRLGKFEAAFSQIKIEDANLSYKNGKYWEIEKNAKLESIEYALSLTRLVRSQPNLISPSLQLYLSTMDALQSAYDFERIKVFEDKLNKTHYDLKFWVMAFEKAHLVPLSISIDNGKVLYPDK